MPPVWFKSRGYKHFDSPVGEPFAARVSDRVFVAQHDWSPLIHYTKRIKRYKPLINQTLYKDRPIMYASHRDACILSKYAFDLSNTLDQKYKETRLDNSVIAYRKLGKANHHFSSEAYRFALANSPCVVLCFDVAGFFDHLNHSILKSRLRKILGDKEISDDWYRVFKHVTSYSKVDKADLQSHPIIGPKMRKGGSDIISTIAKIKSYSINMESNNNEYGVPQGTPISSAFSNLYMIDLDLEVDKICKNFGSLYQRYSDDILIVCSVEAEKFITDSLHIEITKHKLEIKADKCERVIFDSKSPMSFQYLGFDVSPQGAIIRASSLAKQWRKLKRHIARTKKIGSRQISSGKSSIIFTKKLRSKFWPTGVRNFSQYARRSSSSFNSPEIRRQILRLERAADHSIKELNKSKPGLKT